MNKRGKWSILLSSLLLGGVAYAGPALMVIDGNGKSVGLYTGENHITRRIQGVWHELPVNKNGFVDSSNRFALFYTSTDCSGQAYVSAGANQYENNPPLDTASELVQQDDLISKNILYTPDYSTRQARAIYSEFTPPVANPTGPPSCFPFAVPGETVGTEVAIKFDLTTLGFEPPFSLVRVP
jgi:hypothetical protein